MARTVAIGGQDFGVLREKNAFYVDKTAFIREWWNSLDNVTLITRPRRFGKTVTMSMLNYFFSDRYAGRGDLFEGLDIWKDEKFRRLQGTYPVIFMTFAGVKGNTYRDTIQTIKIAIVKLFSQYDYLMDCERFHDKERRMLPSSWNSRFTIRNMTGRPIFPIRRPTPLRRLRKCDMRQI